jgi:hypothetical protein
MRLRNNITNEQILNAIREGVRDAFWQMMTNATDAPCQDFYAAIEQGVENAMENGTRRPDGGGLA